MDIIRSVKLVPNSALTTPIVTVAEAKKHAVIEHDVDDSYIEELIAVASEHVQYLTRRQLLTASYIMYLSQFPNDDLELPYGNLQSIDSVNYKNTENINTVVDADVYDVDTDSDPGVLSRNIDAGWPVYKYSRAPVWVQFTCGWTSPSLVPRKLKLAIKMLVATWYNKREDTAVVKHLEVPHGVISLITEYKLQGWGYD